MAKRKRVINNEPNEASTFVDEAAAYLSKENDSPPAPESPPTEEEPTVYFESRLGEGIQSIYGTVRQMKAKGMPGALKYGVTGGHVVIAEILDNAADPMAYLTIAAYAVATAMIAGGHWDLPTIPQPEELPSEQPPTQTDEPNPHRDASPSAV